MQAPLMFPLLACGMGLLVWTLTCQCGGWWNE